MAAVQESLGRHHLPPEAYNLECDRRQWVLVACFCLLSVPSSCWEVLPYHHLPPWAVGSFGSYNLGRQVQMEEMAW